jgi:hypothetical protein
VAPPQVEKVPPPEFAAPLAPPEFALLAATGDKQIEDSGPPELCVQVKFEGGKAIGEDKSWVLQAASE